MNIYFSGIGGVAIGPLSEIARGAGYEVQGSDEKPSLITKELLAQGIPIAIGKQDGSFLQARHSIKPIDWLIHTSALPSNHPELILAKKLGIKTAKRDELIDHIIREKNLKLIAVAGTHGKTTTTGMLIWALKGLGVPVSYSIGTTISFGPSGLYSPSSEYFIYECDEFDRNFLHFSPYLSLIISIGYDHPDTYPAKEDYSSAFREFIDQSNNVIMWQSDADYISAIKPNGWILQEDEAVNLPIAGQHNRKNATLALKAIEHLGLSKKISTDKTYQTAEAADLLVDFPGTSRRFERLADNLYTDYGHHPSEIKATLQLAKEASATGKVALIYQPHQNVRQHQVKELYTPEIFQDAEEVYWLPTYLSRESPDLEILTSLQLASKLPKDTTHIADLDDDLWETINQLRHSGYLVLLMGAGSIDEWARKLLQAS